MICFIISERKAESGKRKNFWATDRFPLSAFRFFASSLLPIFRKNWNLFLDSF
jgi:hypothetical protein